MKQKIMYLSSLGISIFLFACQSNFSNSYSPDSKLGIDTFIEKLQPTLNFSLENRLRLVNFTAIDSFHNEKRTLLKIRCSSIPITAKIDSAFLYLYNYKSTPLHEDLIINIERIAEDWDVNKVTWTNQPNTDRKSRIKYKIINQNTNYYKIDVTNFIIGIANEDYQNFGLLFKIDNSALNKSGIHFYSSNTRDIDNRPKLKVYFNQNSI